MLKSEMYEVLLDHATDSERRAIQAEYNRVFGADTPDNWAAWEARDSEFRRAVAPIRRRIADRIRAAARL